MPIRLIVIAGTAMLLAGCEPPPATQSPGAVASSPSTPLPPPPPPPPPPSSAVAEEPATASTAESPRPVAPPSPPVAKPTPQPKQETPGGSPSKTKLSIKLSAGVALPQTLPDGTQVGVSVDYQVTGKLHPSARYALIIASQAGEIGMEVKLDAKGTFQGFLPIEIQPGHAPFRARIDEHAPGVSPRTVSNVLLLR